MAREFIEASKLMAAKRTAGANMKHVMSGPVIEVDGARAFSRCHVALLARRAVDGHEFDFETQFRFFDLFEKRGGAWRILKRTAVYEKDRMDPVMPWRVPENFYESLDLSGYRPRRVFSAISWPRGGYTPLPFPVVYSAEEEALRREGMAWIGR